MNPREHPKCEPIMSDKRNRRRGPCPLLRGALRSARRLADHTEPNLSEHDLAHLGAYTAAARLVSGGVEQPACTLTTFPAPEPVGEADAVVAGADRHPAFRLRPA